MCMCVAIILIQNTMQNNIFFERVPKNEPKYKAVNSYTGGIGGVKYNNYNINSKRNRKYRTYTRETVNDKFFAEYCNEVDISTRKIIFLIGFTSLESKTCVKSAKTFV